MTAAIIKPTIGRRVWYWPSPAELDKTATGNFFPHVNDDFQALDAGIVYVWNDRLVNLVVTDHQGCSQARTSVRLLQEGESAADGEAYAQWMPYQQGQTTKGGGTGQAAGSAAGTVLGMNFERPTRRDQLEMLLVQGAAQHLAFNPSTAAEIGAGINTLLETLANPPARAAQTH